VGAERDRLREADEGGKPWRRWGPYLPERQWGTVREDYSADGAAWEHLPHDHSRSRAYRWGEDGLLGLCDDQGLLCLAPALWNGVDPILKERLFGLTNPEGNHGEDVKEEYHYLDAVPSGAWLRALYRYPAGPFPYGALRAESARRGRELPEWELRDAGAFADGAFELTVEYAKAGPEDLLVRLSVVNRSTAARRLHLLPQLWFRNTWSWGREPARPRIALAGPGLARAEHPTLGAMHLQWEGAPEPLLCDNDTNASRLYGLPRAGAAKDAFHEAVVEGWREGLRADGAGTKLGLWYAAELPPGGVLAVRLRLGREAPSRPFDGFDRLLALRAREADEFWGEWAAGVEGAEERRVARQALSGLLWSRQFYHWDVAHWLEGDPGQPAPPQARRRGRDAAWEHLNNGDVLLVPDKWEYPWYAAWDLAFHCVAAARVDPELAKAQLVLLLREWYMHPNGQLPAYEWDLGDANPPVHAWAAWRVYCVDRELRGGAGDRAFLERVFHKLLLNFTWWVNRKDAEGRNVFQGGFLGLDNIGVFDRSAVAAGAALDQADGTSWMATYALDLLRIALELSRQEPVYQDVATKFLEHFLYIAGAMADVGRQGVELWDPEDGFFYDVLRRPDGQAVPLKVRSLVGLIPLFAVEVLEPGALAGAPQFTERLEWFLRHRPDLAALVSRWHVPGAGDTRLLALLRGHRMKRVLRRMLDEEEFLSPFGVRSLSRVHRGAPFRMAVDGGTAAVNYEPAESRTGLFGGNSNWRGPVWVPMNFLLVEALRRFHRYYGDDFRVECPTGSGRLRTLAEVADELAARVVRLFLPGPDGRRPFRGGAPPAGDDGDLLFHEYFDGETGRGLGASHQTGWTALVAELLRPARGPVHG
jgi:hypothetical protein